MTREENESVSRNIANVVFMDMKLTEPWFTFVVCGRKTVECRLDRDKFSTIRVGQQICFHCMDDLRLMATVSVTDIRKYTSFEECLKSEGICRVLPSIESYDEGCAIYRQFYSEFEERKHGVIAIHFV